MSDDKKFTKEKLKHLMAKSGFEAEDLVNLWISNLFVFLFVSLKGARTQKEVFEEYIQRDPLDYDYKLIDDFYKQINSYILATQKIHREPLQTDVVKSELENNPNLTPKEKQARIKAIEVVLANNQIASEFILNEFTELKKFYEKYRKPPGKPDFKEIEKRAQRTDFIPLEKRVVEQLSLFFPTRRTIRLIEDRPLPTGERYLVYEKTSREGTMTISFTIPRGMDDPTFNRCTQNIFLTAQYYASIENRLDPFIKREHFIKRLGSGKYKYRILDDSLKHLTIAHYEYSNEAKGKEYYWKVGHLIDEVARYGKGKGSYYQIRLNPTIAQPIQALIENRKPPQFLKYPVHSLFFLPTRERRAGRTILLLKGLKGKLYPFTIRTFLKKMGITTKEIKIKSMSYLANELDKGLDNVGLMGFVWSIEKNSLGNLNKYKIHFTAEDIQRGGFVGIVEKFKKLKKHYPKEKRLSKKEFLKFKIDFREIKPQIKRKDKDLVEYITKWLCRPEFNTKKPEVEVKKQVYNTIKKYGADTVENIFKNVQNYNPHPREFWNQIKALKFS